MHKVQYLLVLLFEEYISVISTSLLPLLRRFSFIDLVRWHLDLRGSLPIDIRRFIEHCTTQVPICGRLIKLTIFLILIHRLRAKLLLLKMFLDSLVEYNFVFIFQLLKFILEHRLHV